MNKNFDYCFAIRAAYYLGKIFEGARVKFVVPVKYTPPCRGTQVELAVKERCLN